MIDRNHPAVTRCFPNGKVTDQHIIMAETFAEVIREAIPHLTADDLLDTPAGRELMSKAWVIGKLAGATDQATAHLPNHQCPTNPYREEATDDRA